MLGIPHSQHHGKSIAKSLRSHRFITKENIDNIFTAALVVLFTGTLLFAGWCAGHQIIMFFYPTAL